MLFAMILLMVLATCIAVVPGLWAAGRGTATGTTGMAQLDTLPRAEAETAPTAKRAA